MPEKNRIGQLALYCVASRRGVSCRSVSKDKHGFLDRELRYIDVRYIRDGGLVLTHRPPFSVNAVIDRQT